MSTDLEIARSARLRPIAEVAVRLGIGPDAIEPADMARAVLAMSQVLDEMGVRRREAA